MSDPASTQPQDIGQQISSAPDKVWKRLREALRVNTREEAVRLVGSDDVAAEAARSILAGSETVLTKPIAETKSMLGQAAAPRRGPEDVLYPSAGRRGGGRLTI
ncbi:MAG: hypothetical protein WC683_07650 [bacterium]